MGIITYDNIIEIRKTVSHTLIESIGYDSFHYDWDNSSTASSIVFSAFNMLLRMTNIEVKDRVIGNQIKYTQYSNGTTIATPFLVDTKHPSNFGCDIRHTFI